MTRLSTLFSTVCNAPKLVVHAANMVIIWKAKSFVSYPVQALVNVEAGIDRNRRAMVVRQVMKFSFDTHLIVYNEDAAGRAESGLGALQCDLIAAVGGGA